jgi:hypothetical protein
LNIFFKYIYSLIVKNGDWGLGIGDLGIGDWGLGPIPNPQSPIPNPQSPFSSNIIIIQNYNIKI